MRSETFFNQRSRVLLRGPYAQTLQLAGALLPRPRREELLDRTRAILQNPLDFPSRMKAFPAFLKDNFLTWLGRHQKRRSGKWSFEESIAIDEVNGADASD